MKWHSDLYVGKSIAGRQKIIKWKIMHNAGQLRVHVVTLAANPANLLDIIPSWELLQRHYPKKELYVIGLAGDYDEALLLAGEIIQEVYMATEGFDVRSYIGKRGKQTT